ncbi:Erythromycin 3''-O-methyltransferase [Streptomyces netropsis]|uniref:Ubiquinone/menaquinone biosynthesis C-methylase UbiE n=1 Tax=Streptomyces syringium TaxID=76729 RepID=A0ABS4XY98_9ACTN|nr:class I SAM-dependent methyltransferase [Streptomyces syringium]MBP2401479.1 ubiquinone/menaquinone biosynthesis C-methylase UbiE [Streptomyces syringium]SPE47602.1 Erythromycin 3''-O-methyltransferase [Streptomyces netropsis]
MTQRPGGDPLPMRPAVQETYGPVDLGATPLFGGGFINFGHWDGIDLDRVPTEHDRIRSQQALYHRVLATLAPTEGLRAVEVGCGLGTGCAMALQEYGFAQVTGMDIHPQQLDRARSAHADLPADQAGRLRFVQGAAEGMPFGDAEFDCLYSVEAAQHFRDPEAFAKETARVLKPGGRATVASFFVPDADPARPEQLAALLETFATGLDVAHSIPQWTGGLEGAGLTDVRVTSIGAAVWHGWDRWLSTMWQPGTWPRNFLRAYRDGMLDYFLITAARPAPVRQPA